VRRANSRVSSRRADGGTEEECGGDLGLAAAGEGAGDERDGREEPAE
jgi:hypothetical protein